MRNVHRLFVLPTIALIGGANAMRAQIKPTVTLSGSTPIAYKYPAPASFTATQVGPGAVQLAWSAVGGVSYYSVTGPGLPASGLTVSGTTAAVTGMQGPGMLTFRVAAVSAMTMGTMVGAAATQTVWVKGTMSGLVTPNLPAPSFQLKGINQTEGARNDANGVLATTSLALTQNPPSCPYTPMFYYDAAQPPVPAAGYYIIGATGQVEPDSDPAYSKYTIMNGGNTYFRAPTFPGLKYVPPPTNNAWVFIVDCHNAYSNAVQFHVYPTDFQLVSASTQVCQNHQLVNQYGRVGAVGTQQIPGTQTGQQLNLWGTGFAGGYAATDQKVYFHLQGTDANGSFVAREVEAQPAFAGGPYNERQINVVSPDPKSFGLAYVDQATVYVTKSGKTSASLPISYYVTSTTPVPGNWTC
jgi:hypothetical protein